jgi:hypothetical protein
MNMCMQRIKICKIKFLQMILKRAVTLLILLLFYLNSYATTQAGDIIIMGKDTFALHTLPLKSYPQYEGISGHLFGEQQATFNTGCWRGYIAEWTVIDQELYLTNIYNCDYPHGNKANLKILFKAQCINNKVKATWVTGNLWIPKGELIHYDPNGGWPAYSGEVKIIVVAGRIQKQ